MKKLLTTTALVLSITVSGIAYANAGDKGGRGEPAFMTEALAKLPAAKAEAFRTSMKKSHEGKKEEFGDIKKLHEEMKNILTAEKFDKVAYIAKGKEIQDKQEKMHAARTEAFANAVATLSQSERKTLADALPGKGGRHHPKPDTAKDSE